MSAALHDLRRSVRSLARQRSSIVAVVVLALGIGANTAVFSALYTVLLRPLPVADQERVMVLSKEDPARDLPFLEVSYPEFSDWRQRSESFSALAATPASPYQVTLTGRGDPQSLSGLRVSADYFSLLGMRPAEGRLFTADDHVPEGELVVVLGHRLRRELFGLDRRAVDARLVLEGASVRVVGVLPAEVDHPRGNDFWIPLAPTVPARHLQDRQVRFLTVVGRLATGVGREQATTEMNALAASLAREHQPAAVTERVVVTPLVETVFGDARTALWIVYALATLVLLVACLDVASLLLARAEARRSELAVRSALGARRLDILRQLLLESLLLGVAGGALGLALAAVGVEVTARLAPPGIPRLGDLGIDPELLLTAVVVTLVTVVLAGLAPAAVGARGDLRAAFGSSPGTTRNRGAVAWLRWLIAVEAALGLMLLLGAGLLLHSLRQLQETDPGFRAAGVLTARVMLPFARYPAPEQRRALFDQVLDRLRSLPEVEAAGGVLTRPLQGQSGWDFPFTVEGQTQEEHEANPLSNFETVTPGYFEALAVPRIAGRVFTSDDTEDAAPVAVVSRSFANRFWTGEPAVGRQVKLFGPREEVPWRTVVGVVEDVRYRGFERSTLDLYVPYTQANLVPTHLAVRTSGDPEALAGALERVVYEVDPQQPVADVATLESLVASHLAQPRLVASLAAVFALIAATLVAVGIYGLVSYSAARRRREMGLRMALGATRKDLLGRTLAETLVPVISGMAVGVVAAFALAKAITGLLYRTSPTEPVVWLAALVLFLALAGVAASRPAVRAARSTSARLMRELDDSA